jgi:hypothetical protein
MLHQFKSLAANDASVEAAKVRKAANTAKVENTPKVDPTEALAKSKFAERVAAIGQGYADMGEEKFGESVVAAMAQEEVDGGLKEKAVAFREKNLKLAQQKAAAKAPAKPEPVVTPKPEAKAPPKDDEEARMEGEGGVAFKRGEEGAAPGEGVGRAGEVLRPPARREDRGEACGDDADEDRGQRHYGNDRAEEDETADEDVLGASTPARSGKGCAGRGAHQLTFRSATTRAIALTAKVTTNRIRPAAMYAPVFAGLSNSWALFAILEANVSPPANRLKLIPPVFVWDRMIITAMVSPSARPSPSMEAAITPL